MSLNATPRGDRIHIALFGKRNAGKSSVINAMTNQELAIVSDVKGTTTDPVYKAMELLPLGPVVMIDTPGLDDEGELGEKRVKKAKEVLAKADIALVIMDATAGMTEFEEDMIRLIEDRKIPYLKVYNKMDIANAQEWKEDKSCFVSAKDKKGIWELKEEIGKLVPTDDDTLKIVGDLVCPNDFVILVVPIDSAAPKGRLILPQQQTIRPFRSRSSLYCCKRNGIRKDIRRDRQETSIGHYRLSGIWQSLKDCARRYQTDFIFDSVCKI